MLSIGNKKYRNLQEQVGFNSEQIEKIFDVLDGLAVTDNVVAIADLSDNLNENQLEIVQKSVAFLVYGGQLYIKRSEDASNAYFDIVFTISTSGGVISFNSKEIEVVLATGALSQTTATNSTYSSSQIDTLMGAKADITYVDTQLALKANLAGANFTGAITSPSIIENMVGYSYGKAGLPPASVNLTEIYEGIVKNGNKLTAVWFHKISVSSSTGTSYAGDFYIPAEVLAKLYPVSSLGTNVLNVGRAQFFKDLDTNPVEIPYYIAKYTNRISLIFRDLSSLSLNTDYFVRIEQTFLLSDNLAS